MTPPIEDPEAAPVAAAPPRRKSPWRAVVTGLVLAAVGLLLLSPRPVPPPAPVVVQLPPQPQPAAKPAAAMATMAPVPSPPPPPPLPAPAVSTPAPAAPPALPSLQDVQIPLATPKEVPALPEIAHASRPLDLRSEELPIPDTSPSYRALAPQYRPIPAYAPARRSVFSGRAQVTGATSLVVDGTPVELYGIERPRPGDRCAGGADCITAAKQALQSRVAEAARISCREARASLGVVVFATCIDAQGTDLGGMLTGAGLARANARQSYAYLGAENIARDLRKGLWAAR